MSSGLKVAVRVYLAHKSGGVCAHPKCQSPLTENSKGDDEGVIIGEVAHIFGGKLGSARYDATKSKGFVNSAENLIYLCPTHHTLIDKQPESHSVELLLRWKSKHEMKMREVTSKGSIEIMYNELEKATESPNSKALLEKVQDARKSEEYIISTQRGIEEKLDTLNPILAGLGGVDQEVRRRLLGYSRWYDPAHKVEIFKKLTAFGHSPERIESNAQILQDDKLIQITENHYLPLNEEVCQQAAESLIDEFLQELEA